MVAMLEREVNIKCQTNKCSMGFNAAYVKIFSRIEIIDHFYEK